MNTHKGGFFPQLTKNRWKISHKFANKIIDCSAEGISRCKGKCCLGFGFWPGDAGKDNKCTYLGDSGCILPAEKRPITCLLFPFVLNRNNTLVLWGRTFLPNSRCYQNCGKGDKSIISLFDWSFSVLFGDETTEKILLGVKKERDVSFQVSDTLVKLFEEEKQIAKLRQPYTPIGKK